MTTKPKTLDEVKAEYDGKLAELTGVENALLQLRERENEIRVDLQRLEIKRTRILAEGK